MRCETENGVKSTLSQLENSILVRGSPPFTIIGMTLEQEPTINIRSIRQHKGK